MRRTTLIVAALAMLLSLAQANADLLTGLAAYYPFNGNADDASGHGNDGVVHGATLSEDRFEGSNRAYYFDGTDDYIRIADSPSLNITGNLTISAWILTKSTITTVFGNMLEISPHSGFSLKIENGGKVRLFSGDKSLFGNAPVNTGDWTHIAVTLSGTTATSYVNGVMDNSGIGGIPTSSNVDQTIGASYTPHYFFKGYMDDVRIYNRALSYSEIQQLYSVPEPAALMLLGAGVVSLLACVWRKQIAFLK
jgi:hypothetical protein